MNSLLGRMLMVAGVCVATLGAAAVSLPPVVVEALKTAYPDAVIREVDTQVRDGLKAFEVKIITAEGRILDVLCAPNGVVVEVKEVVPAQTVPDAASTSITREQGDGRLNKVERMEIRAYIHKGQVVPLKLARVFFEGDFQMGGDTREVLVDALDGAVVYDSRVEETEGRPAMDATSPLAQLIKRLGGWIGVEAEPLAPAWQQQNKLTRGIRVRNVVPKGPGDRGGLIVGDVLLDVEHQPLKAPEDLKALLEQYVVGSNVKIGVWRNGQMLKKLVTPELVPVPTAPLTSPPGGPRR